MTVVVFLATLIVFAVLQTMGLSPLAAVLVVAGIWTAGMLYFLYTINRISLIE